VERRTVLVVSARGEVARSLREMLEGDGYEVLVTHDGGEALNLVEMLLPEIVLLDIQSPSGVGLQLLQALRKRGVIRVVAVLLLLDEFDEETVARGLDMGAADYLVSPFERKVLLRRVGVLARIRRQWRRRGHLLSRYQELLDDEHHGVFLSTTRGRLVQVNQALVRLLGYTSKEELLGVDIDEDFFWEQGDRERFEETLEREGSVTNFPVHLRDKDGRGIAVVLTGEAISDDEGVVLGYHAAHVQRWEPDGTPPGTGARTKRHKPAVGGFLHKLIANSFSHEDELVSVIQMTELIAGRYERLERLALGSYGEIWKVRDIHHGEAAPCYVAKIPKSKKLNRQIQREGAICRRLRGHPNAVKVIGAVEDRGRLILIQEFVEGPTLRKRMESPLSESERESILLQLIGIVAHAHGHRIVHRDIKPENIIVGRDGKVKLLDYGVAKELKEREVSSTIVGSRPYMAPEQIMGESQIASDVWALGVIMYGMYTEYLPFYHENERVLMDLILTREPDPPRSLEPGIPVALEQVILRCLRKDPRERYPNAGALQEALREQFPGFGKG
jgi:PAS domain S-box-containing protein